jgi:hypothetical protein
MNTDSERHADDRLGCKRLLIGRAAELDGLVGVQDVQFVLPHEVGSYETFFCHVCFTPDESDNCAGIDEDCSRFVVNQARNFR